MPTNEVFIGKREQISVGDETTYGTAVTPTKFIGKNIKIMNPQHSNNWKPIQSAGRDSRNIETFQKGEKTVRFRLSWTVTDWEFLKYTTHGSTSTVDNADGTYTHTLTVSNTLNSFTLERSQRGNTNHVQTYSGCVFIGEITIRFNAEEGENVGWVEAEADVLAQDVTPGTTETSLSPNSKTAFQFRHTKLTIEGSEIKKVNSGEIRLNNQINPRDSRYANNTLDRTIGDPIPTNTRFNMRANVVLEDGTYFTYWDNASALTGTGSLEFVINSDNKVAFGFNNEYYLQQAFSSTNFEGVTNADLIISMPKLSVIIDDNISSY